jgi:hypothetical protein
MPPQLPTPTFDLAMAPFVALDLARSADLTTFDSGGAVLPSKCGASKALLCDGFEAATLDLQTWNFPGMGASISLDNTFRFRGSNSVHVLTFKAAVGTSPHGGINERRTFPIHGTIYVRAFMYFANGYSTNFNQLINFLDSGTGGASFSMRDSQAVVNDYSDQTGMGYFESTHRILPNQWTCLKMSIGQGSPGDSRGDIHIFVGDTEASDAALSARMVPQVTSVSFGADFEGNKTAMDPTEMWIDEVIVDDKPIGCDD